MTRPATTDYPPSHAAYVALVPEEDVIAAMELQSSETQRLLASIDDARGAHRYAEGKWSVKEVIGHVTDGERIFAYRALCVARGEKQSLPSFDENDYQVNAHFDDWSVGDLAEQYALVRRASILMFRHLPADAWDRRGIANQKEVTPRGLAYVMVGHERHHLKVLRERYLI